jgi:hypothetical protein
MTIALIVAGLVALLGLYCWGWYRCSVRWAWQQTERDIERYPTLYGTETRIQHERRSNLTEGFFVGSIWPMVLVGQAVMRRAHQDMPLQVAQLREREKRLVERERELGLDMAPLPPRETP